jgi:hypothetical protein
MPLHAHALPGPIAQMIHGGAAIPAHPLALDATRQLDPRRQRALGRYYLDAGADGLAVGVHTTQFAIREAGLYPRVLRIAAETVADWAKGPRVLVAGIAGQTRHAVTEADIAAGLGYHTGLLSLSALRAASEDELISHARAVAARIPLFGFYLQPSVGGRTLSAGFWQRFCKIENVIGIKIAPFHRYRTLDVLRGVVAAGAEDRIALYTGNDDHIVLDLVTPFILPRDVGEKVTLRIRGGLLGHWSVWTRAAVDLHRVCRSVATGAPVPSDLLALDSQVTAMNAAIFDVANDFAGCIAGCHEILRRQGLLEGIWCLDPQEGLGPGQLAEIDRICALYPDLTDDAFVAANLDRWLA